MLTTYDNPHDPFTHFAAWFKEDMRLGHNTCGVLASHTLSASTFGSALDEKRIEEAMDELVKLEPTIYKKVTKESIQSMSDTES